MNPITSITLGSPYRIIKLLTPTNIKKVGDIIVFIKDDDRFLYYVRNIDSKVYKHGKGNPFYGLEVDDRDIVETFNIKGLKIICDELDYILKEE